MSSQDIEEINNGSVIPCQQEIQHNGNIQIVSFALLPSSNTDQVEHPGRKGIVGNVIFFGSSAYVWASWGAVDRISNTEESQLSHDTSHVMGKGLPLMGSLGLAMPRKRYTGMQNNIPSYTQLIGGTNDEGKDEHVDLLTIHTTLKK